MIEVIGWILGGGLAILGLLVLLGMYKARTMRIELWAQCAAYGLYLIETGASDDEAYEIARAKYRVLCREYGI